MKLLLNLKKGQNLIVFNKNISLHPESMIKVNKGKVLWRIHNIVSQTFDLNSVTYTPPSGYYSFFDLKEYLETLNITTTLEKSGKVTLTPPQTLDLKDFGLLLGFEKDTTISKDTKTTSPNIASINGGLTSISVSCDRVNSLENFYMGKRSQRLFSILVPNKNLFGISSIHSVETKTSLQNGNFSTFDFTVEDDSSITDRTSYIIYLDIEIF